ncbi:DUF732 domain-containing protein [Microbacterium sp. 4-7]|uniref:DUF732 domain-containing protein n=1 Tax=Microbacterium sp. 4-7 TaxID=1885327 RepID=UPI00165077F5|nr:DUF732 domain-containing protein [Microbacterium sp. 4-7]MBC6496115.1 hypothetical protein [Microbacterium sp. 4-7]
MKNRIAALALLAALALTGCAGTAAPGEGESATSAEGAAPLVAEAPEVDASAAEVAFLKAFREIQGTYASVIPDATDEQLLDAGYEACERLAAGEASTDISVIDGEERNTQSEMYLDSVSIVGAAVTSLCP